MKWSVHKEISPYLRRFSKVNLLGVDTTNAYEFKTGEFGYVSVILLKDGRPYLNKDKTDCVRRTFYGNVSVTRRSLTVSDIFSAVKHLLVWRCQITAMRLGL